MSDVVRESVAAYGATLRRMTVREYYLAAESGVLDPDERLELLRGEVVAMSPQKSFHAWATGNLAKVLQAVFPEASIRIQFPLSLNDMNEPEPDVLVALGPDSRYMDRHPGPSDVLLVVEVSDTTLRKDRTLKGPLYAEFGINEYWILDLNAGRLEVYRDPGKDAEGKAGYRSTVIIEKGGQIETGNGTVSIAALLPDDA
ncbi:MAG TPA: Uma2 family endonuclease [Fimbriimonadaceae bacterium]|nr:Uma2 family endonuclease [Fimbriimonadaceae bacterium]